MARVTINVTLSTLDELRWQLSVAKLNLALMEYNAALVDDYLLTYMRQQHIPIIHKEKESL